MGNRNKYLLKRFGITEEQYAQLLLQQRGRCAVCLRHADGFRLRLAVDHDHKTGHIRGLLCAHCNRYVVGRYRKELGPTILRAAADYLDREYPGWIVPPKIKKKRKKRK